MGFKNSADVIESLLALTPARNACFFKPNDGSPLPPDTRFDVVITDMSSRLYSIYFGVRTGRDLLRFINAQMADAALRFGATSFYFCVDDRTHVTAAKAAERLKRADSKDVAPYSDLVSLKGIATPSVPLDGFQFGMGPLPDDYDRLLATDALRAKWFVFVGDLIASHTCSPNPGALVTVTTSGFRRCSCGDERCELACESKVVKTFFMSPDMLAGSNEPPAGVLAVALNDAVAPLPDLGSTLGAGCPFASGAQCARKQHIDAHRQFEKPSICVGEAEGQCFYWVQQATLTENEARALVRVNDSDAVTCALMRVPCLYNLKAERIAHSLWLDLTSTADNVRFFDAVAWWRSMSAHLYEIGGVASRLSQSSGDVGLVRSSSSSASTSSSVLESARAKAEAAAAKPRHGLLHPVETVLFVATLTGTDYCNGLSRLGPSALFKQLPAFLKKVADSEPDAPFLQINQRTGDMIFREDMALQFLLDAYAAMGPVQEAMKAESVTRAEMHTDHSLDRLALFFERKLEESRKKALATGKSELGVVRAALVFPRGPHIRATIRRACFSLYYYYNAHRPLTINAVFKIGDTPLYGYTEDGRFAESVVQHASLRPFVLVGSGSAPPSVNSSPANALKRKSSADADAEARSAASTPTPAAMAAAAAEGDLTRPVKRASTGVDSSTLQWDRRNNGIDLLTMAIRAGFANKPVGNGPEQSWILTQTSRFTSGNYRPYPGEHGSFLPAVDKMRKMLEDAAQPE